MRPKSQGQLAQSKKNPGQTSQDSHEEWRYCPKHLDMTQKSIPWRCRIIINTELRFSIETVNLRLHILGARFQNKKWKRAELLRTISDAIHAVCKFEIHHITSTRSGFTASGGSLISNFCGNEFSWNRGKPT